MVPFVAFGLTNNQSLLHYLSTDSQNNENFQIESSNIAKKITEIGTILTFALEQRQFSFHCDVRLGAVN
jgi:hypothetical protein